MKRTEVIKGKCINLLKEHRIKSTEFNDDKFCSNKEKKESEQEKERCKKDSTVHSGVTEPICNQIDTQTDHLTIFINAKIPRVPSYVTQKYSYLKQTEEGDKKMQNYLRQPGGEAHLRQFNDPYQMVEKLHEILNIGMEECYE